MVHRIHPTLSPDDFLAFSKLASALDVKPTWLAKKAILTCLHVYSYGDRNLRATLGLPELIHPIPGE